MEKKKLQFKKLTVARLDESEKSGVVGGSGYCGTLQSVNNPDDTACWGTSYAQVYCNPSDLCPGGGDDWSTPTNCMNLCIPTWR